MMLARGGNSDLSANFTAYDAFGLCDPATTHPAANADTIARGFNCSREATVG